jgi:hypothetical protein
MKRIEPTPLAPMQPVPSQKQSRTVIVPQPAAQIRLEQVWTCLSGHQQQAVLETLVSICRMVVVQTNEQRRKEDADDLR